MKTRKKAEIKYFFGSNEKEKWVFSARDATLLESIKTNALTHQSVKTTNTYSSSKYQSFCINMAFKYSALLLLVLALLGSSLATPFGCFNSIVPTPRTGAGSAWQANGFGYQVATTPLLLSPSSSSSFPLQYFFFAIYKINPL
jgi:hypothetical protein